MREQTALSLRNYKENKLHPGSFLEMVISGDIYRAMEFADPESKTELVNIISTIKNEFPTSIYGTTEKFEGHLYAKK